MAITTTCPGCRAIFRLPEELAGKSVRCQKCERLFVVPLPTTGLGMAMPSAAPADVLTLEREAAEPVVQAPAPTPARVEPVNEPVLVEPIFEATPTEVAAPVIQAEQPKCSPVVPERPANRLWMAAGVGLFAFALFGTGAFAAIWVSTHLAPPRVVLVPPLKVTNHDFVPIADGMGLFQAPIVRVPPAKPEDRTKKRLVRYLVPWDANKQYEEKHSLEASDPLEPSVPGRGPYKEYIITMIQGQNYSVEMTSMRFPPLVSLFDEQNQLLAHNNGATIAIIDFRPNQTATFRIRAIGSHPLDRGLYSIKITER